MKQGNKVCSITACVVQQHHTFKIEFCDLSYNFIYKRQHIFWLTVPSNFHDTSRSDTRSQ